MRLRLILLAGLAPLFSLQAMADAPALPDGSRAQGAISFERLLRSVAQLAAYVPEVSSASAAPERSSPQAVLEFTALSETPFKHSLWMLASLVAIPILSRRHQRVLLRC